MAVAADLSRQLDKAFENATLEEVLAAPVSALAGVSEGDAEHLKAAFNIHTIADLGKDKHFAVAAALVALGA